MLKLTKQQAKVHAYILAHRGCTTSDIQRDTKIECPSGRIAEMRGMGIKIVSIGQKKYPGTKAFECYAIQDTKPAYKTVYRLNEETGAMIEERVAFN